MRWVALAAALALVAAWILGPREEVGETSFDPAIIGPDLDAYLAEAEAGVPDLREAARKRIVWAGEPRAVAPWSVVYLHGFSASLEEMRPVPDLVAEALGATLILTRLAGHGRDGAAMAEPEVADWLDDMAEAVALGRRSGERVLVIGTSTGGTLAALGAARGMDVGDAVALLSPNFALMNPAGRVLGWPWAERWLPLVAGETRSFEPENAEHAAHWTERYPTVSVLPVGALIDAAEAGNYGAIPLPLLLMFSDQDQVVDPLATRVMAGRWGADLAAPRVTFETVGVGPEGDPSNHVIAGDILSPENTAPVAERILEWVRGL